MTMMDGPGVHHTNDLDGIMKQLDLFAEVLSVDMPWLVFTPELHAKLHEAEFPVRDVLEHEQLPVFHLQIVNYSGDTQETYITYRTAVALVAKLVEWTSMVHGTGHCGCGAHLTPDQWAGDDGT